MGDYPNKMEGELKWSCEREPAGPARSGLESQDPERLWVAQPSRPRGTAKDVRLAKVLRLRAAMANGTYRVSVHELADSMLRCARSERSTSRRMYSV